MAYFTENPLLWDSAVGLQGMTDRYGPWTGAELITLWTGGVDGIPYETAVEARKQIGNFEPQRAIPQAARDNVTKWDTYVEKLTRVSSMTPEQYQAQKSSGSILSQIFGTKKPTVSAVASQAKNTYESVSKTGGSQASGDERDMTGTFLVLGAATLALVYLGASKKKKGVQRFSNPGRSAVKGVKRVFSWPKKILKKVF